MDFFQLTMRIVSGLIMVYFFLIMVRVILSWIPSSGEGTNSIAAIVARLTDPYMRNFRGISWLRFGMLDFSPILGLAILSFLLFVTGQLAGGRFPGVGELLIWLIQMVWGIVAFLATLLAIVMLVRLVTLYTVKGRPNWTDRLDAFLFPKIRRILGLLTKKTVPYPLALGLCAAGLLIARFAVGWGLSRFLYPLLVRL